VSTVCFVSAFPWRDPQIVVWGGGRKDGGLKRVKVVWKSYYSNKARKLAKKKKIQKVIKASIRS